MIAEKILTFLVKWNASVEMSKSSIQNVNVITMIRKVIALPIFPTVIKRFKNSDCVNLSKMGDGQWLKYARNSIPPLTNDKHKGQAGRIGVIGGSTEYTGAPYFAAISALKVGADIVHVFCTQTAGSVVKSYSPELIVHPVLGEREGVEKIIPWLSRLHVIIIGPGLGREPHVFKDVQEIIKVCREQKIPLVIDADGLALITENIQIIANYPPPGVILTPNKVEYERLHNVIRTGSGTEIDFQKLGRNIVILRKGEKDETLAVDPVYTWRLEGGGSGRRCGGQGDILSGTIATFFNWTIRDQVSHNLLSASVACYAGCLLVKKCNEKAFFLKGRSMLASDMIEHIHEVFEELYEVS